MLNLSNIEVSEICNQLGRESPNNIEQVHGGNIHQSWKIEFDNIKFFLKRNDKKQKFLKYEEYCLKNLQKNVNNEVLIIPKVVSYLQIQDVEFLLLEWIDMHNGDQKNLGKGLAEMHLKAAQYSPIRFGFPIEGFIGLTNQNKGWENNWIDCFLNLRINPQLLIFKNNSLENKTKNKITEKIRSELIKHKPLNTLIHGDLWSGNIGINKAGKGVIFDPASWWADNEVDIAMTRLFGGFSQEFYEEYSKVIPLKEGFEKRIVIYNFYHISNHANMFGGAYFYQVDNYIKKILDM